jgi:hypothetical protein
MVSGSDRVMFVEDMSSVAACSVVATVPVVRGLFPRLKKIAGAFPRIRYMSLVFEVCLFDLWVGMRLQHKPGILQFVRGSWC